ncbi:MAG: hypothetical protein UCH28_10455, partial [Adlercreutzia sp.]|nr:hypothetical protein [Adlercreutzia sp.]
VFYERLPLDYLKQASALSFSRSTATESKPGQDIDTAYLERVIAENVVWKDRHGNDVTEQRLRGLKPKVTLVSEEVTEAADYGGSMNYTSQYEGICKQNVIGSSDCKYAGQYVYTSGKAFNDIDPRAKGTSNTTRFGLFKIEWVVDEDYTVPEGEVNADKGIVIDPGESRYVNENEMTTGSKLSDEHTALRPTDRPDYDSTCMEVGDTLSIAIPVRAAEQNLPQVYKNLDASNTTPKNADGSSNTAGYEPAFFPRMGEFYYSSYHLHCGHSTCPAGSFFVNPGPGVSDFSLSGAVTGTQKIMNQNVLMDMDSLLHESAFTSDKPKHVDTYEMFSRAYTFIPGTSNNTTASDFASGAINQGVMGTTGFTAANDYGSSGRNRKFMDADIVTANNMQKVSYYLSFDPSTAFGSVEAAANSLPTSYSFITKDKIKRHSTNPNGTGDMNLVRDYFYFVTASRIADALSTTPAKHGRATATQGANVITAQTDAAAVSATPLVWSQTRVHMQKAWLATSSEMVSDFDNGTGAANSTDDYKAARHYTNNEDVNYMSRIKADTARTALAQNQYNDREIEYGQYEDALEFGQTYNSQMVAYNYGDRNLDGVEFTYIMPRGAEPQVDENGLISVDAELLKSVGAATTGIGTNDRAPFVNETYKTIDPSLVDIKVLQTPYGEYHGYDAPAESQDTASYRTNSRLNGAADSDLSVNLARSTYTNVAGGTGTDTPDATYGIKVEPERMKGATYTQSSQPWVIKITVKQPLGKWFGRNVDNYANDAADPDPSVLTDCYTDGGYKIRVS